MTWVPVSNNETAAIGPPAREWFRKSPGDISAFGILFSESTMFQSSRAQGIDVSSLSELVSGLLRLFLYLCNWMHWMLRRYCRFAVLGCGDAMPRVKPTILV